ncbi:aminopeptidase and bleomycin hydrolase [Scheffersomyces xylosifermentans]|uniref:aminopeptidase and bleomycin hydrolase n=1 Tax=Scheffersomyces xylosifermentans TaxID=1304137 RepID=UPI00315D3E2E
MGANASKDGKHSKSARKSDDFNEKADYSRQPDYSEFHHLLKGLNITESDEESGDDDEETPEDQNLSFGYISHLKQNFFKNDKNKVVQQALAKNTIDSIIAKSDVETSVKDQYLFNVTVDTIGSPSFFNNQKSSGRCWIFAASNVLRSHVIKNYNLKDDSFQLSQAYFFFYDKLEKANFFLKNVLETAEEPLDSRLIQYLFSSPVGDGGQWDMIVNLVEKYGVVPHEVFPDNAQAINSGKLNYILTEKLREFALVLRELVNKKAPQVLIYIVRWQMFRQVFDILSLTLGSPPSASDPFVWQFVDKDGKFKHFETTPTNFYKDHVKFDAGKHFSLIHDPRNEFDKLYTVDRLNNIVGGKPIEYVNTEVDEIKNVAIKMLKDNEPIFFGSDVGKFGDRLTGVLDVTAYDYKLPFNTILDLNKANRLRTGSSQMTHAMVITGVHLDPITGLPVRWKIENSWGDEVGDKGYFVMTDEWFNEYVFQIVTSKKYASKKTYDIWKGKDFNVLPYYDPMGALA